MNTATALARSAALAALAAAFGARAEVADIVWDGAGRFEHQATVAPGKFAEACGRLAAGERVAWSYDSAPATDFNIHYHAGAKVVYPARRTASAGAKGRLAVAAPQDYCWMWTNRSAEPASVRLVLVRRR